MQARLLFAGRNFDHFGPESWYVVGGALAVALSVTGSVSRDILNLGTANGVAR
ncbi:MAG TPA: hypothetical protein VMW87_06290 [Spirochaetia bacterium]|nr:hypothetical protein [Spirochaetia bacterium]